MTFVASSSGYAFKPIADPGFRANHDGSLGRRWSSEWRAWHALAEFTDTPAWRNRQREAGKGATGPGGLTIPGWRERLTRGGLDLKAAVDAEIDALIVLAKDERPDAMDEILSQSGSFTSGFMDLLCATTDSHPATFALMQVGMLVGGFAVQHFKLIDDRRRPSQVCAALQPPIEVPGHGAYPSGHATQAHLIAHGIRAALGDSAQAAIMPAVNALAARIGRNREIAGVHYRSDTEAGAELAGKVAEALKDTPLCAAMIKAARAEWS
jgi:hypothetical protein